jgi:hypothetical protein
MTTPPTPPPPGGRSRLIGRLLSALAGLGAALVLHYILYRVGIAGTPFIYVSF